MTTIWGTVPDWVSAVGNLVVAGAAVAAAWQGIKSLSAWRAETIGRRRMELAEEALANFYEARDIISWVRSPASYPGEGETRPDREEDYDQDRQRHRDVLYVPIERLKEHMEFFSRLQARRYRVVATFGSEVEGHYEGLNKIRHEIIVAAQMRLRMSERGENSEQSRKRLDDYEAAVWEGCREPDDIKKRMKALISAVEGQFRPELGGEKRP